MTSSWPTGTPSTGSSGYVTVTTDSREELTTACVAVEQAAGQAGIELRLLYGAQDVAFACSLPLGRGLS